jgi:hypothetical protein
MATTTVKVSASGIRRGSAAGQTNSLGPFENLLADVTETYEASLGSAEEAVAEGT